MSMQRIRNHMNILGLLFMAGPPMERDVRRTRKARILSFILLTSYMTICVYC